MFQLNYKQGQELKVNFARIIKKNQVACLQNICIEVFEQGFIFTATNLDETLIFESSKGGAKPYKFLISQETLKRIFAGMKRGSSAEFSYQDNKLKVTFLGYGEMSLIYPALEAEGFPMSASVSHEAKSVAIDDLISLYRVAQHGASSDESKAVLNSVCFDSENHRIVSTDGRRLIHLDTNLSFSKDLILPLTKILKTSKIFDHGGTFTAAKEFVEFECGDWIYQCKQVEGDFPNWKAVVPVNYESSIDL
jgi:DNA polymerase III subunit beta